jgi:hypothetical protein
MEGSNNANDRLKRCRIELRTCSYAERSVPIDRPLASFQCWSDVILRQLGLRFGSYLAMSRSIPLERLSRMLFRVLYAFCSERLRFSSCRSRTGTEMNVYCGKRPQKFSSSFAVVPNMD